MSFCQLALLNFTQVVEALCDNRSLSTINIHYNSFVSDILQDDVPPGVTKLKMMPKPPKKTKKKKDGDRSSSKEKAPGEKKEGAPDGEDDQNNDKEANLEKQGDAEVPKGSDLDGIVDNPYETAEATAEADPDQAKLPQSVSKKSLSKEEEEPEEGEKATPEKEVYFAECI